MGGWMSRYQADCGSSFDYYHLQEVKGVGALACMASVCLK